MGKVEHRYIVCTCGTCGYTWDYNESPTPAHRCPREGEHGCDEDYADPHSCSSGMGYVIVETDNRYRGAEAVMMIYGPWLSEERALEVVHELRAKLPPEYASHDEYPVDYEVRSVQEIGQ